MELRIELAPGHEHVFADREAVRQVLSNLFSNAIRYSAAGGSVTLRSSGEVTTHGKGRPDSAPRVGALPRWTVVEVEDTGSGIPQADLSRIFERFYRADPARGRDAGGTGLGLSIVKHIVESHGGWTEAESQVSVGTVIRFVLPAPPTPAEAVSS